MPNLDSSEFVLIIEENGERIKFISGLLEMLDYGVVTAHNLISIGLAIGNTRPAFIIAGTKLARMKIDDLLTSLADNEQTKNLALLVIAEEGENISDLVAKHKNERKISILNEPLDIHQFKREVENLS